MSAIQWAITNLFHPDGAVVYRTATVLVPLNGERPRHIALTFDEFDNFHSSSLNVRVTGGPLRLSSFKVPSKERFSDVVVRAGDQEREKGMVLESTPLNTGQLMVRIKLRNGEEKQITDAVEIQRTPRRKATVHLEFERNAKLTGSEARVPLQINYVLDNVSSAVTYQMNLENLKLEGFVRINNKSNKHFDGLAGYNAAPIGFVSPRKQFAAYQTAARSAPAAAQEYGLDKSTLLLGERHIRDRANLLFISEPIDGVSLFFEVSLRLPDEARGVRAQPVMEFPANAPPTRLTAGSMMLYDGEGHKLTTGTLTTGASQTRVELQPLDHSVTVDNKPDFEQLAGNLVEVSNALSLHHTGTKTTKLRIQFPEFMRWGTDHYNATFESNLAYVVKLQPGINQDVVKIKYQRKR